MIYLYDNFNGNGTVNSATWNDSWGPNTYVQVASSGPGTYKRANGRLELTASSAEMYSVIPLPSHDYKIEIGVHVNDIGAAPPVLAGNNDTLVLGGRMFGNTGITSGYQLEWTRVAGQQLISANLHSIRAGATNTFTTIDGLPDWTYNVAAVSTQDYVVTLSMIDGVIEATMSGELMFKVKNYDCANVGNVYVYVQNSGGAGSPSTNTSINYIKIESAAKQNTIVFLDTFKNKANSANITDGVYRSDSGHSYAMAFNTAQVGSPSTLDIRNGIVTGNIDAGYGEVIPNFDVVSSHITEIDFIAANTGENFPSHLSVFTLLDQWNQEANTGFLIGFYVSNDDTGAMNFNVGISSENPAAAFGGGFAGLTSVALPITEGPHRLTVDTTNDLIVVYLDEDVISKVSGRIDGIYGGFGSGNNSNGYGQRYAITNQLGYDTTNVQRICVKVPAHTLGDHIPNTANDGYSPVVGSSSETLVPVRFGSAEVTGNGAGAIYAYSPFANSVAVVDTYYIETKFITTSNDDMKIDTATVTTIPDNDSFTLETLLECASNVWTLQCISQNATSALTNMTIDVTSSITPNVEHTMRAERNVANVLFALDNVVIHTAAVVPDIAPDKLMLGVWRDPAALPCANVTSVNIYKSTHGQPDHFFIGLPDEVHANVPFSFVVKAKNAANATLTDYNGTVNFSLSDSGGQTLPSANTLDNGVKTFIANVLYRPLSSNLEVFDTVYTMIRGTANVNLVDGSGPPFSFADFFTGGGTMLDRTPDVGGTYTNLYGGDLSTATLDADGLTFAPGTNFNIYGGSNIVLTSNIFDLKVKFTIDTIIDPVLVTYIDVVLMNEPADNYANELFLFHSSSHWTFGAWTSYANNDTLISSGGHNVDSIITLGTEHTMRLLSNATGMFVTIDDIPIASGPPTDGFADWNTISIGARSEDPSLISGHIRSVTLAH